MTLGWFFVFSEFAFCAVMLGDRRSCSTVVTSEVARCQEAADRLAAALWEALGHLRDDHRNEARKR